LYKGVAMKKQDIVEIRIDEIKFPNIGIGRIGDKKVQIKGALPGQRLSIRILKAGRAVKANVLEVFHQAPQEIAPKCGVFGPCGGCAFQNIPYDYELQLKTDMVRNLLSPLQLDAQFLPTIPAISDEAYRNKMEFSFGDDGADGNLNLGMRRRGSFYEVVDASGCLIAHPDFGRILAFTRDYFAKQGAAFYHRKKHTGTLRHLVVRRGALTGEILVNLVTTGGDHTDWAAALLQIPLDGKIVGIIGTVNNSVADAIIAEEIEILHGNDFYHEQFSEAAGGQRFKVGAFSFFQTNSQMAGDALYATIADFAGDVSGKTIFDLYCGTGTIGIYLARHAADVIGIEIIEEAVHAADENAALNSVTNCRFIAGDVRKIVKTLDTRPDVIILDPPREGINPKAVPDIIAFDAKTIVYVSCKPSSLLNDLPPLMSAGYRPTKIRCVDMFPRTANIEVVIKLVKNN